MLNRVRPKHVARALSACLLSLTSTVLAVSSGAPPPPPTWYLGEIDEPLTIPQEGIVVLHAAYEAWGGFYEDEGVNYAVTVSGQDGEEIPGEVSVEPDWYTLTWRATSGPLEAGADLTLHLELNNHSESFEEDLVRDIALVVSDAATPAVVAAEILEHSPHITNQLLPGYTCHAPNSYIEWAPPTALPSWTHRLLSYSVAIVTDDGDVRDAAEFGAFAHNLRHGTWIDAPEEVGDDHCLQITTKSIIDDSVVVETSCIDEQTFTDDLDEGQVLCTADNVADHANPTMTDNQEAASSTASSDGGGCHGGPHGSGPWLLALLGLVILARQRKLLERI